MLFGPVTIKDDRGVVVPLFDEGVARGRENKEAVRASVEAHRAGFGRSLSRGEVLVILGWLVGAFAVVMACHAVTPDVMKNAYANSTVLGVMLFIGTSALLRVRRQGTASRARAALLKIGRCASCGYSLEGLSVEGDGRVMCAECGGAWVAKQAVNASGAG